MLLREWTERAPEAAFAFAIDRDLGHLCAKAWGELHPATVESAVAAYLDRQGRSDVDRRKLLDAVASGVVLKEPAPAIAKWKAQAPRKLTPRMVRAWYEHDRGDLLQYAAKESTDPSVAAGIAHLEPEEALRIVRGLDSNWISSDCYRRLEPFCRTTM